MTTLSWKTIPAHDVLAVHGYVHETTDNLTLYVPNEIINFIVIWYYDVSIWKIEGEQLTKFLSLKNGESIYSKPFKINGITFHCSLCPNGWKTMQLGFVQYYLEMKEIPGNISSFTVYFEFYCYETKCCWKGIRTLSKINDAVGWYNYTLPLKQCQNIINVLNLKYLTFGCCIEILNINYLIPSTQQTRKTQKIRCIQPIHLKLNRYVQKTWILNKYPSQRFKHCVYPKNFHSPSFENNYLCFECQANFDHIYCRLKLIRMPYNIKNIKVKCKLQTNMRCESDKNENGMDKTQDNGEWEIVDLNFKHNYTKWKAYLTHDHDDDDSIRISVNIEILQLIDWNNVIIDVCEWHNYDIINNSLIRHMSIQYADDIENNDIENNDKNQLVTNLECSSKGMIIKKEWIKPNFLNIPSL